MAVHTIENVRCVPGTPYGEWRCDISSSSSSSSSEYFSSAEISSQEISSETISSEGAISSEVEISSLEASSIEEASSQEIISSPFEISSVVPEQPSSEPGPQPPEGSSAPYESSGELSSEESLLPCVPSGRCEEVSCFECCAVQIREILTDVYSCPPSGDDRDIILWFYTPEEIARLCHGHGEYCDFVAYTETACDEVSHIAILYFDVCCGCSKPSS
jgi:hypothetical protein